MSSISPGMHEAPLHGPATNGHGAQGAHGAHGSGSDGATGVLAILRTKDEQANALGGLGPLAVGIALFLLMALLAPSVAPERIVEKPANPAATTTTVPGP